MTDPTDVTLLPCPDCGGQGINTDTLGTKTAVCRKCKGSGRTPAAAPDGLVERVKESIRPVWFATDYNHEQCVKAVCAAIAAMPAGDDVATLRAQLAALIKSNDRLIEASSKMLTDFIARGNELDAKGELLAAQSAQITGLRQTLLMIEAIGDGSKTANSLPNIADIARQALASTKDQAK